MKEVPNKKKKLDENTNSNNSEKQITALVKRSSRSTIIPFPNFKTDSIQDDQSSGKLMTPPTKTVAPENLINESSLPSKKTNRLEELPIKHLETYSEKYRFVLKVEGGLTVPQACREINWTGSLRTAYDTYDKFKKFGKDGLIDGRWQRKPDAKVLTHEAKEIIMAWYYERGAAQPRAIWKLTCRTCRERNLTEPAETTVKNFLYNLPIGEKLAREGSRGLKQWQKQHASVIEQNKTSFSNELWQGDHTELPIWTRRKMGGKWVVAKVYASALLDDYSRTNPGLWVSHKYPDSWSISILYRQAILRTNIPGLHACGLPFSTEMDQGTDWISKTVQTMLVSLGIQPIIDPAYFPNAKGKVERFFRFLDTSLLTTLPGHKKTIGTTETAARKRIGELLTLEQLREEINKWRIWYHNRVHSKTERKPIELWEETVRFRYPESEDDLNILLLKYDRERTILNCGIKLVIDKVKHLYWSNTFDFYARRRVRIRYNPEDMLYVLIYCADSGEFLCKAQDTRDPLSNITIKDVKASRRQEKERLTGLSNYFKNVLGKDRLIEQRKEWDDARLLATQLPEITEEENSEEQEIIEGIDLLRKLNRQQD